APLNFYIVYSKSVEEHENHIMQVLLALEAAELKVSGPKSLLFAEEIQFVGHMISKDGIKPMQDKIEAIQNW
ncbi:hypothetical protein CROQUDRAFT_12080, partial [Cronartium quercuum f. sp. fusiforme G11]